MKPEGRAAVILPLGVLFRGNREGDIRRRILNSGYVKGIVGLPPGIFFGTSIPTCIVLLDMENAGKRKGVFVIDASREFAKDHNMNRLREQDIHKIVSTYRASDSSSPRYGRFVPNAEIEENDYNLNIARYINSFKEEQVVDIDAIYNGGIPNCDLDAADAWKVLPNLRSFMFQPFREGYCTPSVAIDEFHAVITSSSNYGDYVAEIARAYDRWKEQARPILTSLGPADNLDQIITQLSQMILSAFSGIPMLNRYDVYQVLMDYWNLVMQDDVFIICTSGYESGRELIRAAREPEGLLLPWRLLAARYFPEQAKELDSTDKAASKAAHAELEAALEKTYEALSVDVIKQILLDDKWYPSIMQGIEGLQSTIIRKLVMQLTELSRQYETTLPQIDAEITRQEKILNDTLRELGFSIPEYL